MRSSVGIKSRSNISSFNLRESSKPWTPAEFGAVYDQHQQMVRSVAFRICGEFWHDDLVQDIFVALWKKQHLFEERNGASLKTWIYRIAINHAIDHVRKTSALERKQEKILSLSLNAEEGPVSAETLLINWQTESITKECVVRAMARLSVDHRTVIVLFYLEENSIAHIAELLQLPLGTIKSRLHHSRKLLIESLRRGEKI